MYDWKKPWKNLVLPTCAGNVHLSNYYYLEFTEIPFELEQRGFTIEYCLKEMKTKVQIVKGLIRLLLYKNMLHCILQMCCAF